MALVSKNVVYAEETVEPSIARDKICKAAGLTTTKKLQGNKDEGYWCGAPDGHNSYIAFLECPAGSYVAKGSEVRAKVPRMKCIKGSRNTVEPTKKGCGQQTTLKGDKNSGYFCEAAGIQNSPSEFTCPSGSKQAEGNSINWRTRGGVRFAWICEVFTLTPEQKQKAKEAGAEAAGKDLLSKSPELAKITSDPKVVGECIAEARSKAASSSRYAQGSGSSSEELRNQFLAECLAKKTGRSEDEVKAALQGADIQGAIAAGEQQQQATEQQLAQEQAAEGEEENKGECGTKLDTIGYFVCPLLEKLVDFADGTWGLFEYLLQTDPLPSEEGPLQSAWNGLRDVANAILAIIFLAIIISQVSNVGISNYGVKKMLPRLIIAAITINMSYFLMQVIVDVANILGANLYHFISDLAPAVDPKDVGWGTIITDIIAGGITIGGGLLAGKAAWSAAAGMDAKVGLLLLLVFIIPAILGLIAGLMALVFRTGIIPVLAISSPIAIAAWVLPNTQKLFEKWKSTFLGMVFLYPLASMYCGGLKFVALIILSSKNDANEVLFRMMAVTMLLLGTGFVAVLAIKSNSIMGGMINGIKNAGNKLTAPAVNSLSSYAGAMAGAAKARRKSEIASRDYSKETEAERLASRGKYSPLKLATRAKYAIGRRRQSFDQKLRAAKAQEAAFEQESQRKFDARVADDPSILGKAAQTVGGKAYIREAAYKAAKMELDGKYGGNAVDALNRSNDEYVKALAAKEIAEREGAGEISKVREYLENGGAIVNTDMAEALQKMKKRDVGVAEVGERAMDRLKQSGGEPVRFNSNEIAQLTREGFERVGGDVQAAEQNATAIQDSGMQWKKAANILGDRHIVRSTPDKNIVAIEAKFEASLAEDIKNNKISQEEAMQIVTNERIVEHISSSDLRDRLLDIATRPTAQTANGAQQQSGGTAAQTAASSGQARQAHSTGQTAQQPPSTPSSSPPPRANT